MTGLQSQYKKEVLYITFIGNLNYSKGIPV